MYRRGVVACQKCEAPIYVHKFAALPDEISLSCARCGARGIYSRRALHVEDVPERRKTKRRQIPERRK